MRFRKQLETAPHSSGTDHRISRNHLLKRGVLLNGQKLGNLVLYMTLGSVFALASSLIVYAVAKIRNLTRQQHQSANGQPKVLSVESEQRDT